MKRETPRGSARADPRRRVYERRLPFGRGACFVRPTNDSALELYCILVSTRHSRVQTRLIGEPVVDREISIVTRAGKSFSTAAADFAPFAKHQVRESLGRTPLRRGPRKTTMGQ